MAPPTVRSTGAATAASPSFTYTPGSGFASAGGDSFTYTVDDGYGGAAEGTVTITFTNSDPTPADDEADYTGEPVVIAVMDNDDDPDGIR